MDFITENKSLLYTGPQETAKTTIVFGKSKSGKTHFITDELNKLSNETKMLNGVVRPLYDKIVIFTESMNAEPFKRLNPDLPIIFVKGYIPKLVLLLKRINDETHNKFKFLCVLDDCLGSSSGKSLRGGSFPKMMLTMRNSNISTCVLVQSCTLLDPKTRENTHQMFITGLKIRDMTRCINELLYDEARRLFPDHKLKNERLAVKFFDLVGSNILMYDNLNGHAKLVPRQLPTSTSK